MTIVSRSTSTIVVISALVLSSLVVTGCSHQTPPAAASGSVSGPAAAADPNLTSQTQQVRETRAAGMRNMGQKRGEMMKRMRENQKGPQ